jgi:hypothetical protein
MAIGEAGGYAEDPMGETPSIDITTKRNARTDLVAESTRVNE